MSPPALWRPELHIDRRTLPAGRMNWQGASGEPHQPPSRPVTIPPSGFPTALSQRSSYDSAHPDIKVTVLGPSEEPLLCGPQQTAHGLLSGHHRSTVQIYTSFELPGRCICVCVCLGGEVSFQLISCENIWSGSDGNWPPEAIWGSMCQRALIRMCLLPFYDQKNTPVMRKTSLAAVCLVSSQPETLTHLFRSNKWSYHTNIYLKKHPKWELPVACYNTAK